jgi:hypothetical protein
MVGTTAESQRSDRPFLSPNEDATLAKRDHLFQVTQDLLGNVYRIQTAGELAREGLKAADETNCAPIRGVGRGHRHGCA